MSVGSPATLEDWAAAGFAACGIGLCVLDAELRVVLANRALLDLLGCETDPTGLECWHGLLGSPEACRNCPAIATLADGQQHRCEFTHLVGARHKLVSCITHVLKGADGEIAGVVAGFEDVTEAHELAQALAEAQAQHSSLLDYLQDGIVVAEFEMGNIMQVNKRACELLGRAENDLLALRLEEAWPVRDRDRVMAALDQAVERGSGVVGEVELQRPDGGSTPVQLAAARVGRGSDARIQVVLRDVSDAWQQRRERLARNRRLSALEGVTRSLNTSVERSALELKVVHGMTELVQADLFALYLSEHGHTTLTLTGPATLSPRTQQALEALVRRTVDEFRREGVTYVSTPPKMHRSRICAEGEDVPIASYLNVPITVTGRMVGLITVASSQKQVFTLDDLMVLNTLSGETAMAMDRLRAYRRSARADRFAAAGQTMAAITDSATDIANGLASGMEVMDAAIDMQNWRQVQQAWAEVRHKTEATTQLIHNMLKFSHEHEPLLEPVSVATLLEDVVHQCQQRAEQAGVRIELAMSDPSQTAWLDPEQIEHCLLNLVGHGIDAMPTGGTLTIRAGGPTHSANAGDLVIEVADSGRGIDPKDLSKLFRVPDGRDDADAAGLELAVAKKIVDEHQGQILARSEVGKGATFTITIPTRHKADPLAHAHHHIQQQSASQDTIL